MLESHPDRMKNARSDGRPSYLFFILAALAAAQFVFLFLRWGPIPDYDTHSYVVHSFLRQPLYPLIIDLFKLLAGSRYEAALCAVQIAAVLASAARLALALRGEIPDWLLVGVFCLVSWPLHSCRVGNYIDPEGAAYAVLLVFLASAFQVQSLRQTGRLALLAGLIALDTLIKAQMIFLYPVYALLLARLFLQERRPALLIRPAVFLAAAFAGAGLLTSVYNLAFNGVFSRKTVGGRVHFAAEALYVSEPADLELFAGAPYYPAIERIYKDLESARLLSKFRFERDANLARYFSSAADPAHPGTWVADAIVTHTLERQLYAFAMTGAVDPASWNESPFGRGPEYYSDAAPWVAIGEACQDIFHRLLRRRWRELIKLDLSKVRNEIGFLPALVLAGLLALPFLHDTPHAAQILLVLGASLGNLALMGATFCYMPRYTFYSYALLPLALLLIARDYRPAAR